MSTDVAISEANTDAQRAEVQELFSRTIRGIAPNAIPAVKDDHLYAPLVLHHHDIETGQLAGAALTCRSQVAVGMTMMRRPEYAPVMHRHSELDLMAVAPAFRGRGIGSALVRAIGPAEGAGCTNLVRQRHPRS
ncbi:GNAT family N-acetyltransferase [Streptomyces lanatus]|uniref:GNAT family N-acetyltransferase n=1 Tax=Streptomyces lanatus TaxID=66900 RepID=A0ABV1Y7K2_9ACTN|nr:GNAT family N-acetyltransferase [Streptomyces lanatus]